MAQMDENIKKKFDENVLKINNNITKMMIINGEKCFITDLTNTFLLCKQRALELLNKLKEIKESKNELDLIIKYLYIYIATESDNKNYNIIIHEDFINQSIINLF